MFRNIFAIFVSFFFFCKFRVIPSCKQVVHPKMLDGAESVSLSLCISCDDLSKVAAVSSLDYTGSCSFFKLLQVTLPWKLIKKCESCQLNSLIFHIYTAYF